MGWGGDGGYIRAGEERDHIRVGRRGEVISGVGVGWEVISGLGVGWEGGLHQYWRGKGRRTPKHGVRKGTLC